MAAGIGTSLSPDPFMSASYLNYNQNTNRTENVAGTERPYFTPNQLALQPQALDFISKILGGGQLSSNFVGPNDAIREAAWHDFRKYQMPQLAAIHGAGSPTIQSAGEELNLKLAALNQNNYNAGFRNALDAFNMASTWALTPLGRDETKTGKINEQVSGNEVQAGANIGNILEGLFRGTFPGTPTAVPQGPP